MQAIKGLHHITAVASDPQRNVDFYHHVLGQRLVKTTVNFDDPGTYHFYFGDEVGTPGTILTFFPWRDLPKGRIGNGETAAVAYRIRPDSAAYWRQRLLNYGVEVGKSEKRFGAEVIAFSDPDGMRLELVTSEEPAKMRFWEGGPVPEEHALGGFHGVTLWLSEVEKTAKLLSDPMGYTFVGEEGERYRLRSGGEDNGMYIDIVHRPGYPFGRFGSGSIHHIAFRAKDDEEQLAYRQALIEAGQRVTDVRERQYFRSIYYRSPGGVLFEIATDGPGFSVDETIEALGQSLKLPAWLEPNRKEIEAVLPRFTLATGEVREEAKADA